MPHFAPSASAPPPPFVRYLRLPVALATSSSKPPPTSFRHRLPKSRRRLLLLFISTAVRAMASEGGEDHRLPRIASAIRVVPDFPKPGRPPILKTPALEGVS
ncbi:hypothetical protein GW17_00055472 [Ensete ventricosum]|nr:hypothetical protein GW17_00055472 [Ensete ventricosum]